MKWSPDSIAAIVLIAGCILLMALSIDGEVKAILTMSAGWLFASQYQQRRGGK